MKRSYLLLVLLFTLSACDMANISKNEINTSEISPSTKENLPKDSSNYLAENESELSVWDFDAAYKMCTKALTEYYKAIWNGSDIDLNTYIDNANLKQYMQKKITSQYELFLKNKLTNNLITGVDIGARKVEYAGGDNSYLYLKIDTRVNKDIGSYAEPTELLVQSLNGRLVIVDWYSSGKDSYDATVRGENQMINNPDIWNNRERVNKLGV